MLLHEVDLNSPIKLGKKAENLAELSQAGFSVPKGFGLQRDAFDQLDDIGLLSIISSIGGFPVAVRSSGAFEDLEGASFAGMYESYLNVSSLEELKAKIHLCFESATSERIQQYASENLSDVDSETLKNNLFVLIQKMAPAKIAGVAFGINPLSGLDDEILIEYIEGLGEDLVSGKKTPETIVYSYKNKRVLSSTNQLQMISETALNKLVDEVIKIGAHFGSPQDIEWTIDENENVYIVQSRPITKVQWPVNGDAFTNADFKDGGVSARVCTPFMYSLYETSVQQSMQKYFEGLNLIKDGQQRNWMNYSWGRAYWNAGEVKRLLFQVPEFNEKEFDQDLGIQKDYGKAGHHVTPISLKSIIQAIPVLIGLMSEYKKAKKLITFFPEKFESMDSYWKEKAETCHTLPLNELIPLFKQMIEEYYLNVEPMYFSIIYNNSNFQSDTKKYLSKLENLIGPISYIHLIGNIDSIGHLNIQKDLEEMHHAFTHGDQQKYESLKSEFLKHHYHHSSTELDLLVERWGECPEIVDQMVKDFAVRGEPPKDFYTIEKNRILKKISELPFWKRWGKKAKFEKIINESRYYLSSRELFRSFSTRAYYVVRLFGLAINQKLNEQSITSSLPETFMLTHQELSSLDPMKDYSSMISERFLKYQSYANFTPPNEFGDSVLQIQNDDLCPDEDGRLTLTGIGCSAGTFDGIARVITSLDEQHLVKEGEILITQFTDPGWTPLLGRVKGVATEVGGILSHAAVIGREYGIPAVLNIPNLTKKVQTGDQIHIDGTHGKVIIKRHEDVITLQ